MRVLLLGSDAPLGQALQRHLQLFQRHELELLTRANCRWKSERQAKKAVRRCKPEFIVDLRVIAAADADEHIPDIEANRTRWLAKVCQRSDIGYFYLSSARVFSGRLDRLYTEDDYPESESEVGELLLRCEEAVRDACEKYLLIRLGPVFSHHSNNLFTGVLEQLLEGGTLPVSASLRGCPVASSDAARVIGAVIDQFSVGADAWGIYHYCSSDVTSSHEFAEAILASASQFTEFAKAQGVLERTSNAQGQVRTRGLDCSKIRNTFAIKQVTWRSFIPSQVTLFFAEHQQIRSNTNVGS